MTDPEWLQEKEQMLSELQHYINRCSAIKPFPADYVHNLLRIQAHAQIANEDEIATLLTWWEEIRPNS